jgi:hypothetical protein
MTRVHAADLAGDELTSLRPPSRVKHSLLSPFRTSSDDWTNNLSSYQPHNSTILPDHCGQETTQQPLLHFKHKHPKAAIMADDEGASPKEQLIEACRRNNTTLLSEVFASKPLHSNADSIAKFLNTTTDALGSGALHVAAKYGSYEILDMILDQEMVEIDGPEKRDGDTALHVAVRYCNGLDKADWEHGRAVVDILVDAGCDPR